MFHKIVPQVPEAALGTRAMAVCPGAARNPRETGLPLKPGRPSETGNLPERQGRPVTQVAPATLGDG